MMKSKTSATSSLQGLPCLTLSGHQSHIDIAFQGAQVLSWIDSSGRERLYLSSLSGGLKDVDAKMHADSVAEAAAIRGGIPVCFPQFSDRGKMVKHGFVRNLPWRLSEESNVWQDSIRFELEQNAATLPIWPYRFHASLEAKLAQDALTVTLNVINSDIQPWSFTAALHTYLKVEDIRGTAVTGLAGGRYQDATQANLEKIQEEESLLINAETDRVYLDAPETLTLLENGRPSLRLSHAGFKDTVIWNPGPIKAAALKDFPDDDWLRMLCIEAACVKAPVELQPGESWQGSQTLYALIAS